MTFLEFINRNRGNRRALLLIVYIALFLDNMLLTTVVPIVPEYLLRMNHANYTEILLNDKIKTTAVERVKRDLDEGWRTDPNGDYQDFAPAIYTEQANKVAKANPGLPDLGIYETKEERQRVSTPRSQPSSSKNKTKQRTRPKDQPPRKGESSESGERELTDEEKAMKHKIGYTIPMFAGFGIMFLSTLMFAFGGSLPTLWLARALQGVGSACTSTSGMGMLAQAYPDDLERGSAMGIALGGLALGVLVGPPYGGALYALTDKALPFVLLALLALADGTMQFLVLQPKIDRGEEQGSSMGQLVRDPYVIVAAGAITIGNLGIAMLEPSLPLWMMESWGAKSFERGAAFLPASISYLIGTNIFGPLAHRMGRWLSAFIGLVVIGFCLLAIPSANSIGGLIIPNFCMGFSIGMIDASMFPLMGWLVDLRHVGVYGSIYAIADAAFCFAFALGPFLSGPLVKAVGFPTMLYIIAIIVLAYSPLMFLLKNPPARGEHETLPVNAQAPLDERYEKIEGSEIIRSDGYQYDY